MTAPRRRKPMDHWNGRRIAPGEARDVTLAISESYSGMTMEIPIHVRRARTDGPVVFVTAAMHGDEINGTGAIRRLLQDDAFQLLRGALILVPVLNLPGFDRHSRYLPDRRDLNRCFPGSPTGSLASRMAHAIFDSIVMRSDYGIDLHTAAVRRTNYPNVRGDLAFPAVRQLAETFGSEIIVNSQGPHKALRPEACAAGCPTIMMEGGEVWKVEPAIVAATVRGVRNVLGHLGMLDVTPARPEYQVIIEKTRWVRAERGGFLEFHVAPGQIVDQGQPLATSATLLGRERRILHSPFDAVVIGMTTLPAVSPGEPVCNLGRLPDGTCPDQLRQLRAHTSGLGWPPADDLADDLPAATQTPP